MKTPNHPSESGSSSPRPDVTRRHFLAAATAATAGSPWLGGGLLAARPARLPAAERPVVPDWIAPGKLRWVWALWEPLALYRRGGYGAGIGDGRVTGHWVGRWYDRMHSDEILDKLADAGVNLVTTHFYKGFGLKAEADEMARAADFTRRAHVRGIRVLGYHQFSTVIYETMLDEVPNLRDWIQRAPDGSLQTYGSTWWRWMACPIHDEFIAYLKRVVDRCLIEAGMDGVEYDGTSYECYCRKCTAAFRQFLTERHPKPRERFGLPHFRHVEIPPLWDRKDPIWQEWIRFRIDLMGRRLRGMRAYVHQTKPGAALATYEDCPALWRSNRTRLLPDRGDYLDLAIAESHDMPQVLDGQLVTKVRHLKEGTAIGVVALSTDWLRTSAGGITLPPEVRPVELDMAECLACGGQVCTATWSLRAGDKRDGSAFFEQPEFHAALKRYMGFARDHEDLYIGSQPCANVWVYHSLWSLAFDHATAYNSVLGFEQALLGRIAYRVAKEAHLGRLGPRDVLIVAAQTCLSDRECDAVRAAVARGCGFDPHRALGRVRRRLPPAQPDRLDRPARQSAGSVLREMPGADLAAVVGLEPGPPRRHAGANRRDPPGGSRPGPTGAGGGAGRRPAKTAACDGRRLPAAGWLRGPRGLLRRRPAGGTPSPRGPVAGQRRRRASLPVSRHPGEARARRGRLARPTGGLRQVCRSENQAVGAPCRRRNSSRLPATIETRTWKHHWAPAGRWALRRGGRRSLIRCRPASAWTASAPTGAYQPGGSA